MSSTVTVWGKRPGRRRVIVEHESQEISSPKKKKKKEIWSKYNLEQ